MQILSSLTATAYLSDRQRVKFDQNNTVMYTQITSRQIKYIKICSAALKKCTQVAIPDFRHRENQTRLLEVH